MCIKNLQQHLNQRVRVRLQNVENTVPGVVRRLDGTTLTLRVLTERAGRMRIEEKTIPCSAIVSVLFDDWR